MRQPVSQGPVTFEASVEDVEIAVEWCKAWMTPWVYDECEWLPLNGYRAADNAVRYSLLSNVLLVLNGFLAQQAVALSSHTSKDLGFESGSSDIQIYRFGSGPPNNAALVPWCWWLLHLLGQSFSLKSCWVIIRTVAHQCRTGYNEWRPGLLSRVVLLCFKSSTCFSSDAHIFLTDGLELVCTQHPIEALGTGCRKTLMTFWSTWVVFLI